MFENTEGAIKKGQPEKLAPQGTQDKQNKSTTHYVLDTTMRKQNKVNKTCVIIQNSYPKTTNMRSAISIYNNELTYVISPMQMSKFSLR